MWGATFISWFINLIISAIVIAIFFTTLATVRGPTLCYHLVWLNISPPTLHRRQIRRIARGIVGRQLLSILHG